MEMKIKTDLIPIPEYMRVNYDPWQMIQAHEIARDVCLKESLAAVSNYTGFDPNDIEIVERNLFPYIAELRCNGEMVYVVREWGIERCNANPAQATWRYRGFTHQNIYKYQKGLS